MRSIRRRLSAWTKSEPAPLPVRDPTEGLLPAPDSPARLGDIADGFEMQRAFDFVPTRVAIHGERSTGTNFLEALLLRHCALRRFHATGWKHGFLNSLMIEEPMLVIGIVRDWRSWLPRMYRKPWHASDRIHQLEFHDFLREPWHSYFSRGTKDWEFKEDLVLQNDRHPISGEPIANIVQLRNLKHRNLLGLRHRGCNYALVKYEWLNRNPQDFLDALGTTFGIETTRFKPIKKEFARNYPRQPKRKRPTEAEFAAELPFIREQLDARVEAKLGYTVED